MDVGNVIEVKNLKKKFKVFYDKGSSLKEKVIFRKRNRYEDRWVLNGVSFTVKKGEAIGLIGKNGCGKSTTLKMLSKIMYPTEGTIEIKGRVSSLLELGAGFHPDMSGRENIYTNASIFGLNKKEIDQRLGDIIAFSELEEFIDNPVRTYSSGMYMRLAFSVAINVDADVLLIDEILAVGDVSFQTKCFEKLKDIKAKGTTIVLVSHATGQIEAICDRAVWIEDGLVKEMGIPKYVNEHYLAEMEERRMEKIAQVYQDTEVNASESVSSELDLSQEVIPAFCSDRAVRVGNRTVIILDCKIYNGDGEARKVFRMGEKISVSVVMKSSSSISQKVNVAVSISRDDGLYCYGHSIYGEKDELISVGEEPQEVRFIMPDNCLLNGKYYINLGLYTVANEDIDVIWNAVEFRVKSDKASGIGIFMVPHYWDLK